MVLFSVGSINSESVLIKTGYFSREEYSQLRELGYVGDICSRYLHRDGSHASGELYERVIGLSLEEIKRKEHSICVAIGKKKAEGILSALKGGYINTLFTDEITAKKIIELNKKERMKNESSSDESS
ncbi:hypothetical protein J9303_19305 [Bacillaceae bacterium Marseille-Q3522]|nr:hypothetical protein [Bacillaceae bacterium Marseille-Q3522]